MGQNQAGTLAWKKYKEPPTNPDSKWIVETIKGAFSFSSEKISENKKTQKQKGKNTEKAASE